MQMKESSFNYLEEADQLTGDERKHFAEKVRGFILITADIDKRSVFIQVILSLWKNVGDDDFDDDDDDESDEEKNQA